MPSSMDGYWKHLRNVIFYKGLTCKNQLNKVIYRMASGIRSLCVVRRQVPFKTRVNLFKSLVKTQSNFCIVFLLFLSIILSHRINRQITSGMKRSFLKTNYKTVRDLLLEIKLFPTELQETRISLNSFSFFCNKQETALINISES